jgi:hypothetical protein
MALFPTLLVGVFAQFDMIADKWNNEWIANYYAAYAKVITSFIIQDSKKKDMFLDAADKYLEKVKSLGNENDETWVLAALITSARIASLFFQPEMFGGGKVKAKPYLEKAKELFAKESKTSILKPYWGEIQNLDYLKQCE